MSRKVNCDINVRVNVDLKGSSVQDFVDECSYDFQDTTGNATVEDIELRDYKQITPTSYLFTFRTLIRVDEDVEVNSVINEMEYTVESYGLDRGFAVALVTETELVDYQIKDSR